MQDWSTVLHVVRVIKSTLLLNNKQHVVSTYNFKKWLEEFRNCTNADLEKLVTAIRRVDKNLVFDENNVVECVQVLHDAVQYVKVSQLAVDGSDINKLPLLNLKYGKEVTFGRLWNNFYLETRGIILDLEDERVLSATANKFFNFGEYFLTPDYIKGILEKSTRNEITDKEDGSMISVFKYKGQIMTATPGSMISSQAIWARDFLEEHHKEALELWQHYYNRLTLVFEAIYPENRVVRNYNGESKMVLLLARDLDTGEQLTYEFVEHLAKTLNVPIPKHENKTLEQLMEEAQDKITHPADQKEGWVIRIDYQEDDGEHKYIYFKLKCEDYCILHKLIGDILNPKFVMEAVIEDKVDDVYAKIRNEDFKSIFLKLAQRFLEVSNEKREEIIEKWNLIPKDIIIPIETVRKYSELNHFLDAKLEEIGCQESLRSGIKDALIETYRGKGMPRISWGREKIVLQIKDTVPEHLKDQKDYFKYRGMFSAYVHKNMADWFKDFMFIVVNSDNRQQTLESIEPLKFMEVNQVKIDDILAPIKNFDADA